MLSYKKSLVAVSVASLFLLLPISTFAQTDDYRSQRIVTLGKDQVVNHDYFGAGDKVVIDGIVNGDVYVAGGQVDVNGVINGDLLIAGGDITVRGKISQNVRVVGGNITIRGDVQKNVSVVGGDITIDNDANIAGNAVIAGGNIEMLARVQDATMAGGSVIIRNDVLGNAKIGAGQVEVTSGSTIHGNLDYWSSSEAVIASDAKVLGKTAFYPIQRPMDVEHTSGKLLGIVSGLGVAFYLSVILLSALLVHFFPEYSRGTSDLILKNFWTSFLVGFIALVVTPIAGVLLLTSVVGIPIALMLFFVYGVVIYFSKIFAALAIGTFVGEKAKWKLTLVWAVVVGLLLYYIVGFIPLVGPLMKFVVLFVGVGAIVLQKKNYYTSLRKKNLI